MSDKKHVTIRTANENDLQAIIDIYNEVVINTTTTFEEVPRKLEEYQKINQEKLLNNTPFFVAEIEKQIVGFGSFGPFRKASGYQKYTLEHSLNVAADFRGKGVGSLLLKELIKQAKLRSYHSLIAALDANNKPSRLLHQKFGFKTVGQISQAAKKFDQWLDLTLMQLILD